MVFIEPLRLSVTAAASILDVSGPALSTLLNGHPSLSPDMALWARATIWARLQRARVWDWISLGLMR